MKHDGAPPAQPRWPARGARRWPLVTAMLGGIGGGVALTLLVLRPTPVAVASLGSPAAAVVDARGRAASPAAGAPLRAGDRVKAGAHPVTVSFTQQTTATLGPRAELTVLEGAVAARVEQGGAVLDATASVEEVRIATPAGEIVATNARVEIRAVGGAPGVGPVTLVRVERGNARLVSPAGGLPLGAGDGGALVAGRPPVRTSVPERGQTAALAGRPGGEADDEERDGDERRDEGNDEANDEARRERPRRVALPGEPAPIVIPVGIPVAVPVAVPVPLGGAALPAGPGVVEGVVELDGARPAASATAGCDGERPPWSGDRDRLADVYVRVTSPLPRVQPAASEPPVVVVPRGCGAAPGFAAVVAGRRVELRAAEGGAHHLRLLRGDAALLDEVVAPGAAATWLAAGDEILRVRCDAHPGTEASAFLAVSPHPHFAVTGADGRFRLAGLPTGRHTLRAWHAAAGERTAEVTVTEGRPAQVRFTFQGETAPALVATPAAPIAVPPPSFTATPATPIVVPPPSPTAAAPEPTAAAEPPRDPDACRFAGAGSAPRPSLVAQACAAGGVPRAKLVMQQIVHLARARGVFVTCRGCHADEREFELAPRAREQLGRLLTTLETPVYFVPFTARPAGDARGKPRR